MKGWVRYLLVQPLALLLLLLLLLLLGMMLVVYTKAGTYFLSDGAQKWVTNLELTGVEGTLGSDLSIAKAKWHDETLTLELDKLSISNKWSWQALQVKQLKIDTLVIRSLTTESSPTIIPSIMLPLEAQVVEGNIGRVEYWSNGELTAINQVQFRAHTRKGVLFLEELVAMPDMSGYALQFNAQGEMKLQQPHETKLTTTLTSADPTLGLGTIESVLSGPIQNYQLAAQGTWAYQHYPEYQLEATATGSLERMEIENLKLQGDGGTLNVAGKLDWYDAIIWELKGTAENIDPEQWQLGTSGQLDATFLFKGESAKTTDMQLVLNSLNGVLQDYPVEVSGDLGIKSGAIFLERLDAMVGDNKLHANGKAETNLAIDWSLDAPDLSQITPALSGYLVGTGNLSGELDASRFAIDMQALKGEIQGYKINATGRLGMEGDALSARDVQVNLGNNTLTVDGDAKERLGVMWKLNAKNLSQIEPSLSGHLAGNGQLEGSLDIANLNLIIDQLSGQIQGYPLQAKGQIKFKDEAFSAKGFTVDVGKNRLTLDGEAAETLGVDWVLAAKDLKQLNPNLSGKLNGKGNLKGLLDGSRLDLMIDQLEGNVHDFPVKADGQIKLKDKVLTAKELIVSIGANRLALNGEAADSLGIDWILDAKKLSQLSPTLSGALQAKGNLKGLLDGSLLDLNVERLQGTVKDFPVRAQGGVKLRGEALTADNIQINIGENQVTLNGEATDAHGIDWVLNAQKLQQLQADLSGNLVGKGNIKGLLDGSDMNLRIDQLAGKVQEYPIKAQGELRLKAALLSAKNVVVSIGDNQLRLDGTAGDKLGVNWVIDARNLQQLSPSLSGGAAGHGRLAGRLDGSQLDLAITQLVGKVQNYPLMASGGLQLRGQVVRADNLVLGLGQNRLLLNGSATDKAGVVWALDAKNLAEIDPQLVGSVRGDGRLRGLLDGSQLDVTISQLQGQVRNFPVNAQGRIALRNQLLSAQGLQLSVGDNSLILNGSANRQSGVSWTLVANNLSQIQSDLRGRFQGNGVLRGELGKTDFDIVIQQLAGQYEQYPLHAQGRVQLQDNNVIAQNLLIALGQNRLLLNGSINDRVGIAWSLEANNLGQIDQRVRGSVKGNGRVQGALDGSQFAVSINQLNGRVQDLPIYAKGQVYVQGKAITAKDAVIAVGQNRLLLNGSATDQLGFNWSLDAQNLTQLSPQIRGALKGNGTLQGKIDGSELVVNIQRLGGQLEGYPLQASGTLIRKGEMLLVSRGLVRAGGNNVQLNGRISEPFDLQWQIDARDLSTAYKGLAGRLQGQGVVTGRLPLPTVRGNLTGSQLRYQDMTIQTLTVQIDEQQGRYRANGHMRGFRQGQTVLSQVLLDAQGSAENHTLNVNMVHADAKVSLLAQGRWQQGQWNGVIKQLALTDTPAGHWQMSRQTSLQFGGGRVNTSEICLSNGQGLICVNPMIAQGGVSVTGRIQRMPLNMLRSYLPNNIVLAGTIDADFKLEQRNGRGIGQANIRLPDNVVQIKQAYGQIEQLAYRQAHIGMTLNDRVVIVNAQMDIDGRGQLRAEGRVDLVPDGNHRINGRASLQSPNLVWLERLVPQFNGVQGQANVDVQISGAMKNPSIKGTARLQNGKVYLAETGTALQDINLTIQTVNAQQAAIAGSLRAGNGQLTVRGNMNLAKLANWSAEVRLQGNQLLVMDTHEVQSWVSPDLTVVATPNTVKISGTVSIPTTIISLRELPTTAKVRSDDVVIVGKRAQQYQARGDVVIVGQRGQQNQASQTNQAEQPVATGGHLAGRGRPNLRERDKPLNIIPNVQVILGNNVRFTGIGLDANLRGAIRVLSNRQGIIGQGSLNLVRGVYKAYGQSLNIERGRLIFNGPIENPGLDLRAIRSVDNGEVKVGIAVGGTVRQPVSSLFSSPVQTQSDTLSYLLTGRALSGVSGSESAILRQAITGLGIAGGESIASQLGNAFGLDEVGLSANGSDYRQSELLLGKRLGPKLYIKYIVGLFDSLQRIAITYQVNDKVQLEAQTGEKQGVDLIYKLDTDFGPLGGN